MIQTYRVIRSNWHKNHRQHGGLGAVARCLAGTLAIRSGLTSQRAPAPAVEVLTFSVVPWMTVLWARLLRQALDDGDATVRDKAVRDPAVRDAAILIGDCSGGLGRVRRAADPGIRVLPCLNDHHGDKIDLFLARLCAAPYVLIADDDVFWLDGEPLAWALARLDEDPRVAAVSLRPRRVVSTPLQRDGVDQPMGSHCLIIRLDLWRRERLSFAVAPPPAGSDWFYDTGDLANRELLRRGYRVVIAPPEIERGFVAFDGVSAWVLKIQGHSPERLASTLADFPVRQEKALQAVHCARGLAALIAEAGLAVAPPEIVPAARLAAAERVIEAQMPAADRAAARRAVEERLGWIRGRLRARAPASAGAREQARR